MPRTSCLTLHMSVTTTLRPSFPYDMTFKHRSAILLLSCHSGADFLKLTHTSVPRADLRRQGSLFNSTHQRPPRFTVQAVIHRCLLLVWFSTRPLGG